MGSTPTVRNEAKRKQLEEIETLADCIEADFVRAFQSSTLYRQEVVADDLDAALGSGLKTCDPSRDGLLCSTAKPVS